MTIKEQNLRLYESDSVVRDYTSREKLQLPELTILQCLADELDGATILDVGVGAGRTTPHLAKQAKCYIGTDLSVPMLRACNSKFKDQCPRAQFKHVDVCSMKCFADAIFDLAFFSFNGIDLMDHEDRLKALAEIKRVLKIDGRFVFSTHNLRAARKLFDFFPPPRAWKDWIREVRENYYRRRLNPGYRVSLLKQYVILRDGSYGGQHAPYYIDPLFQAEQLTAAGFHEVKMFSYSSGREIHQADPILEVDPWIYYMTKADSKALKTCW